MISALSLAIKLIQSYAVVKNSRALHMYLSGSDLAFAAKAFADIFAPLVGDN